MDRTRVERVLDLLAAEPAGPLPDRLCTAATNAISAAGAGIVMLTVDGHFHTVGATGDGVHGEELQLTLGEGPSYDTHRHGQPITVADLASDTRWPMFGPDALEAGIAAVFAFPLRAGVAHFGALTLYRDGAGALEDEQYRDALVFARVALDLLVGVQADQQPDDLHEMFSANQATSWAVHQATGMVTAQLGVSTKDALARLRGHAFANGKSLPEVAQEIVAGALRLDDEQS